MGKDILILENVNCGYDSSSVVNDISFVLQTGEHLCILGANGCGKTTILKAISGILPYNGEINLVGSGSLRNLKRKNIAKRIAMMSQITNVHFPYTIFETVMMGRYVYMPSGLAGPSAQDKEVVMRCLKEVGLFDMQNKSIASISGGQMQRVLLARCFAQEPDIILLDEPTNHLDFKYQIELLNYLRNWSSTESRAIIGVLHDINLALEFADKILVMKQGRMLSYNDVSNTMRSDVLNQTYGIDVKKQMTNFYRRWEEFL